MADYPSGRRKFISIADEGEARRKANQIAIKLANSEGGVLQLTSNDRAAYLRSIELLKPAGKALELAAAEYAAAREKLGPHDKGVPDGRSTARAERTGRLPLRDCLKSLILP